MLHKVYYTLLRYFHQTTSIVCHADNRSKKYKTIFYGTMLLESFVINHSAVSYRTLLLAILILSSSLYRRRQALARSHTQTHTHYTHLSLCTFVYQMKCYLFYVKCVVLQRIYFLITNKIYLYSVCTFGCILNRCHDQGDQMPALHSVCIGFVPAVHQSTLLE